ncbi:unnamed protein product [Rotaria magnacalcarata]|uniref:HTH psq-type domain-containing protein n=1 Tax=Rotaria magnacalcarata TaxID=392030 RepID=A0A816MBY1_9BILA|nr:unnamed protein product [Rotaria magnacalcarata]
MTKLGHSSLFDHDSYSIALIWSPMEKYMSNSNFHCIVILICTHRTNVEQIFKRATVDAVNSPYDSKTAAEIFYVPASTIRRLRGESSLRSHVGRPSYLSNDEELYFVSLLQLLPKYGQSLGLSYRHGVKWLCLFMNRHANDTKWQREGKTERERAEGFIVNKFVWDGFQL